MMKRLGIIGIIAVVAALGGYVLWRQRASTEAPTGPTSMGSAHARGSASARPIGATGQQATAIVTVRGAAGPLAGATVRLQNHAGDVITAQTVADGTATAAVEADTWTISASAPGHEPAALADRRELRAGETARVELTLTAGGRMLTGLVTDATGGPIAAARIDAAKLGMARPDDAIASTFTGADGTYALSVAQGQLLVAASEASYAPQSRYVDVGPSGGTASFQLVPGGVIEGVVLDEKTRSPIANAAVGAERDEPALLLGERSRQRALSGADGRFRISGLRPGSYNLSARAGPQMSRVPTMIGLGVAEQVSDVEILVTKAPSIRGTVVDDTGAPVPDIEIITFGPVDLDRVRADAKGAFEIMGVQPGRYSFMPSSTTYLPDSNPSVQVENADVDGVKLTVKAGLTLAGHVEPRQVCDINRELPAQATFDVGHGTTTTGPNGAFNLAPLQATTYVLEARCPSGAHGRTEVTVAAGLGEVVLEVKPGASIAGRVVDGSGKPVPAVTVMASATGESERTTIVNGMITSGIQGLTAGDGTFVLRGLGAGTYRLGALERGRPLPPKGDSVKVTLALAEAKAGVTLAVDRPDGVIRGVVTGPDGKPLADAWVSLHVGIEDLVSGRMDEEGHGSKSVVMVQNDDAGDAGALPPVLTDASGAFEIRGLARIPMTVVAEAQAGKLRGQAMGVVADASINIQVLALTALSGTVKSPGAPPSWFTVELDGPSREQRSFATGDGTFSFARLDPGDYEVTVTSSAGNGVAKVKIVAGQPATVEVVLAANAIVVGKLVDAAGKPLGGLAVIIIPDAGDGRMRISMDGPPLTSSADGTFRIEAKAGRSGLVVMTPPRPTTRMGLVLEAGKTLDVGMVTVDRAAPPK